VRKTTGIVVAAVLIIALVGGIYYATMLVPQSTTVTVTLPTPTSVTTKTTGPPPTTLVIDVATDPMGFDPVTCGNDVDFMHFQNIFDTLVWYNKSDTTTFQPRLAERWDVSSDGKTWTFYLRKNVKFSNGDPFDSYAVWYSFYRVSKMDGPASYMIYGWMPPPFDSARFNKTVEIVDKYTIRFNLEKPYGPFLATLSTTVASIINPRLVEEHGGIVAGEPNTWMTEHGGEVTTGPFVVKEWVHGDHVTLVRNPMYWGEKPKLEQVIIYFKGEALSRVLDIKKGAAHAVQLTGRAINDVLDSPGVVVMRAGHSFNIEYLYFDVTKFPYNITEVRRAIAHAINYDAVMNSAFAGYAQPFVGPNPKGMLGHDESMRPYQYDPELSKQLLAKAGFPGGKGLPTLKFVYPTGRPSTVLSAQQIQADLTSIGLDVELVGLTDVTWVNLCYAIPHSDPRYPSFSMARWMPDFADPDNYAYSYLYPGLQQNLAQYNNTRVTKLLEEAKNIVDKSQREKLYFEINKIVYDEVPYIWLAQYEGIFVMRDNVHGYYYNPMLTLFDFREIWLS